MAIFIIFASIVALSLALQWLSKRWVIATGVPCALFTVLILSGALFPKHVFPAFVLGLPMIFFASLLGSYLYETRFNPDRHESQDDEGAIDQSSDEHSPDEHSPEENSSKKNDTSEP